MEPRESGAALTPAVLAGCLAHEIRNPLNTLSLTLQFLERIVSREKSLERGPELERHLRTATGETERIKRIVEAFLELARGRALEVDEADLGAVVALAVEEARGVLAGGGEAGAGAGPVEVLGGARARVDAKQLRQAVAALVENALEAPGEGAVRVSIEPLGGERGGARIAIADGRRGFTTVGLARALEPFFTTKEGRLGLGLPRARAIVEAHGGRLTLGNQETGGAIVQMEIPGAPAR